MIQFSWQESRTAASGSVPMRKVRAPQSRITDNIRRGRPQDKCNRDIPPAFPAGKGGKAGQEPTGFPGDREAL